MSEIEARADAAGDPPSLLTATTAIPTSDAVQAGPHGPVRYRAPTTIPFESGRWRGGLPSEARRTFCELFAVREFHFDDGSSVRAASIGDGVLLVDPVDASDNPDRWACVRMQPPPAAYDLYRRGQVLMNRDAGRLGWQWRRNQFLGRPAYIVGSGPSAALAREFIPRRGARRGLVFAINNAAKLFPGDHDFWCLADALWPDQEPDWQRSLLEEWRSHDHTGAWGLFQAYSNARAIGQFLEQGGCSADFYVGWNDNPYRDLAGTPLPGMVTGLQGLVEVIHAAYWLGCGPILLFGCDQARRSPEAMHAVPTVGWRTGTVPDQDRWVEHPGLYGPVETCLPFVMTAKVIACEAAFLHDARVPVFNCSEGLELLFALYLHPREAVALCEATEEPSVEEALAMTPSLGRRAEPIPDRIVQPVRANEVPGLIGGGA